MESDEGFRYVRMFWGGQCRLHREGEGSSHCWYLLRVLAPLILSRPLVFHSWAERDFLLLKRRGAPAIYKREGNVNLFCSTCLLPLDFWVPLFLRSGSCVTHVKCNFPGSCLGLDSSLKYPLNGPPFLLNLAQSAGVRIPLSPKTCYLHCKLIWWWSYPLLIKVDELQP